MGDFLRLTIMRDTDMESPRGDEGNIGTFLAWHSTDIGDVNVHPYDFDDADDARDRFVPDTAACCFPVYIFDDGDVALSLDRAGGAGFSGQVGWIYATPQSVYDAFGADIPDDEQLRACLAAEIESLGYWMAGNGWGFTLARVETCDCCGAEKGDEEIDSCWGFIGDDDAKEGIAAYLDREAHALLDEAWEQRGTGRGADGPRMCSHGCGCREHNGMSCEQAINRATEEAAR